MKEDLVTVVAPAYNHAAYIKNALNSIKRQSYQNKEMVIIDDCSTDQTPAMIREFLGESNKIGRAHV